ncbi:class III poly(R)-hydroxyalkanoic acid synthase PhaE subunit [Luteibacter rhizovicinus]|uniref:Poly(3-hydroxyalkanoate) polymerase subunit PhaE n=1 Tax=Luteibacter rhizovicinus TaxID=242606 RepID=A0A4R3YWA8_9GAMM|nr:poly(R)-hydroxyalkanoic acid synthase subunit PhaE [Luteibacter rhizovicinus]TCV97445.1 class III poly(R)-hydroxyalkanoic acid synthase PhaE subunit [Luteibacter rhizovicinus]
MPEKGHDFIDQYQNFVREGWDAWSRQMEQGPGAELPGSEAMGRLFGGLDGYGEWLKSMAAGGDMGAMPMGIGGIPPFGAPLTGESPEVMTRRFEEWLSTAREALGMPGLGIGREQHEEQQALLRAALDYAQHFSRYQALLGRVHDRAAEALKAQGAVGTPTDPESLRALYDRWVNLAEQAYGEAALSDEFREVYASVVNAQMRLRVLQQHQVERLAVQLGMPTRKEVDSLGERLQAVRRELRHMTGLAAEVESLRAEVNALRGATAVPAKKTASATKAATKKTVSPTKRATTKKTSR